MAKIQIQLLSIPEKQGETPFTFDYAEVPEHITVGGSHKLVIHSLVGGARVIDAMGRDDADLSWSGHFLGANANNRSAYLDGLRIAGKPLRLRWYRYDYDVLVSDYHATFEQAFKIPYTITFKVIKDNAKASTAFLPSGFDDSINDDSNMLTTLSVGIGSPSLTSAVATLNTAVKAVRTFVGATTSTINSVLAPLKMVQTQVSLMIVSATGASSSSNLLNKSLALTQLPQLYAIQSVANRLGGNLNLTSGSNTTNTITQTGGNLYQLAQRFYGDATRWTTIAQANGLSDPDLIGINTLKIPANSMDNGGVYTQ